KGLEYPMVVLAGMSRGWPNSDDKLLWTDSGDAPAPAVSLSKSVRDPAFEAAADREKEHAHAERIRLLYVATTRAETRLAVSGHGVVRTERKPLAPREPRGPLRGAGVSAAAAPSLGDYAADLLEATAAAAVVVPDAHDWEERREAFPARSREK